MLYRQHRSTRGGEQLALPETRVKQAHLLVRPRIGETPEAGIANNRIRSCGIVASKRSKRCLQPDDAVLDPGFQPCDGLSSSTYLHQRRVLLLSPAGAHTYRCK